MKHYMVFLTLFFSTILLGNFEVGEKLPQITLPDQFDTPQHLSKNDKMILFTFEKDVSETAIKYIKKQPKGFLEKNKIKYISDISKMPSMVTSWFAIPKMKKYPFSLMLIYDKFGKKFKKQKGKITIYRLQNYKILSIEFISPKQLSTLFQ